MLAGCNHIRHRFVRAGAVGREHDGRVADSRDRNEIALDVIWHFLDQSRVQRDIAAAGHHQRIAVRVGPDGGRHRDQAVAAWPVFHDHLMAPIFTEFGADKPRRNVGNPAGRVGDQDANGPVWKCLRLHGSGEGNEKRRNCDCSKHGVLCYLHF
jgi:hypothetical protein